MILKFASRLLSDKYLQLKLTLELRLSGLRAILSGPAGGVVGYARTSYDSQEGIPVIGFDMGGTSTDVSRYAGEFEQVFETTTAGIVV